MLNEINSELKKRLDDLGEAARKQALQELPEEVIQEIKDNPENSKKPIIIYADNKIEYANPAALKTLGYSFRKLTTFNDIELDTGSSKQALDTILNTCSKEGLHQFYLNLSIRTLDEKELQIKKAGLTWVVSKTKDYWVAHIIESEKIDNQYLGWFKHFQHAFTDPDHLVCKPALTEVKPPFMLDAIGCLIMPQNKLIIDFKETREIDKYELGSMCSLTNETYFKNRIFVIQVNKELYDSMASRGINQETVFPSIPQTLFSST